MSESNVKNCVNCSQSTSFDAELAYKNLSRKYTELADILTTYMSQAGLYWGFSSPSNRIDCRTLPSTQRSEISNQSQRCGTQL
jgi:hypothetical protein